MVGMILAAGGGTRFAEGGCCKPLLPVNGKPLIAYSLDNLTALGVSEIMIVVGKYGEEIRKAVGSTYCDIPVRYTVQPQPKGIMNAVYLAGEHLNSEAVALQLSDEIFIAPRLREIEKIKDADFLCGYTVPENPQIIRENYALFCEGDRILSAVEKPKEIVNEKKGTGFCVFSAECLALLHAKYTAETSVGDLCDFMNMLVENGRKGIAVHIAAEEINVNDPGMYIYAEQRLERAGHE